MNDIVGVVVLILFSSSVVCFFRLLRRPHSKLKRGWNVLFWWLGGSNLWFGKLEPLISGVRCFISKVLMVLRRILRQKCTGKKESKVTEATLGDGALRWAAPPTVVVARRIRIHVYDWRCCELMMAIVIMIIERKDSSVRPIQRFICNVAKWPLCQKLHTFVRMIIEQIEYLRRIATPANVDDRQATTASNRYGRCDEGISRCVLSLFAM